MDFTEWIITIFISLFISGLVLLPVWVVFLGHWIDKSEDPKE